jgi:hypothetical protein
MGMAMCDAWEREKWEDKILILFYWFGEWTLLTIVGEYYSVTKLVRLLESHQMVFASFMYFELFSFDIYVRSVCLMLCLIIF